MLQDLHFALRMLRRSPSFALIAILTLALGIGANTAIFSIIDGALLRPLAYRDPARLVDVLDQSARESRLSKLFDSYNDYREWSQHARSFEELGFATWAFRRPTFSIAGASRQPVAIMVSDSFFSVLGISAQLGRTFRGEDLSGCAVVLSHAYWAGEFHRDPAAVGRSIAVDRKPCLIAGVMPPKFSFYPSATQIWLLMTPQTAPHPESMSVFVVGRLKPGVSREQARTELAALHTGLHQADGNERELTPVVDKLQDEFTWLAGRNLRSTLWALLAAVGLVLLIACVNVANLLLGRAMSRGRELAIRAAVGCGRSRLLRQLLTEGMLLAVLGGALGIFLASAAVRWFGSAAPVEMPAGAEFRISLPVLGFTVAVSLMTAVLFGLAPAWKASRTDVNTTLKSGGRGATPYGGSRLAKILVTSEVALSLVLLSGAGLMIESVLRMGSAPLGYSTQGVYSAAIGLPDGRYADTESRARFYDELQERIATVPGVERVSLTDWLPPYGSGNYAIEIEGRAVAKERRPHDVGRQSVGTAYFDTLGVPLRRGRLFDARDRSGAEAVAIVDEALAREYFPGEDPIGRRLRVGEDERQPWLTIVGVVGSEKHSNLFQEMSWSEWATVFRPLAQDPVRAVSLAVRTGARAAPLASAFQRQAAAIDPEVAIGAVTPIAESVAKILAFPRFRAILLGAFAGFALLLAVVGLHGVLTQMVARRTAEIGVRIALGAQPRDVVRMIAVDGGAPVTVGLAIGLAVAMAMGRVLGAFLYQVRPGDTLNLAGVVLALLSSAAVSISLPARRAANTDPLEALRRD